ncbi:hypothetical protein F1D05_09760 [Kribbella qitaiheensis]|uniref:Uncharacterized protein n=1 Tax=Kribbella qitaiheensis TaxID=1544730 RepID=A0A7G6WVV7_9ACTN|nr:hypothetical protein [Kribbella qitaiheensis]QNE18122.1 hypothetical protein F1D05_09760 [Kribbella qitaiheensis]
MTKAGQPETGEPRRLRWSVPAADVSVNEWLDIQENISSSLRLLIRQSIGREGYTDVVNKPVDHVPRHDQPVPRESEEAGLAGLAGPQQTQTANSRSETAPSATSTAPTSTIDTSTNASVQTSPHVPATIEPKPGSTPARPQASIDEIMSATRK